MPPATAGPFLPARAMRARYRTLLSTYLAPHWPKVALLTLLLAANLGLQLLGPLVVRHFLDVVVAKSALSTVTSVALGYILITVLGRIVAIAETYAAEDVAWTTTNRLRTDLALHCLDLDLPFHHAHPPGELIERIDGDVTLVANVFSRFVLAVLGNSLLLLGMLIVLIHVDPRVGLILAAYAVGCLLGLTRLSGVATSTFAAAREASAALFSFLEERLRGTEDVRANGATGYLLARLEPVVRQRLVAERRAAVAGMTLWGLRNLLGTGGNVVAYALIASLYLQGAMTVGTAYLIYSYSRYLMGPLGEISGQIADFAQAGASLTRIITLLETRPALETGGRQALPSGALALTCDHVTFGYAAAQPVLHDLSFALAPGAILGVVGRTGSGKTTLARLLCRLYDPTSGIVRLGGVDLRHARIPDLRARVGVVTQEVELFHASIRDNLTLFDDSIADGRLLSALDDLGLGEWVESLPQGLNTVLATGGGGMSAGQAQLLVLARVFLTDPGLLLLDEASARLDPATEGLLDRALDRLLRGRTAIIIAHRLTTVARADEIIVLADGRIREHGPRARLGTDLSSYFARVQETDHPEVAP